MKCTSCSYEQELGSFCRKCGVGQVFKCFVCGTIVKGIQCCPTCKFDMAKDWEPDPNKPFDNATRQMMKQFGSAEQWRNTKGLAGFGCLTLYFAAGCFGMMVTVLTTDSSKEMFSSAAIWVLFLACGILPALAAFNRWKLRNYHMNLARNPPDHFPARPEGISDKQYAKILNRMRDFDRSFCATLAASGHIETSIIKPLPDSIRAQHVWIPGLPGYGKSTLMHWMIMQDIESGKGVTVIDPAGDLVGNDQDGDRKVGGLIDWIPYERHQDAIYLDLKTPIPIDFFPYQDDDEKIDLAGNLVELFNRLGEMFGGQPGVRFSGIVREIVYTLFEAKDNGCPTSFIDIYDFIKDPDRRKQILATVSEKTRAGWDRFPNDEKTEPIISRLTPIAKNPRLRTIFGTPDAKLRIADVMNEKSIFLVNLHGATEAGIILGTMIISQLMQAAMRRSELAKDKRVPHHVYIDEFQNFQVGSDMAKILTQCRKYKLCLTLANQYTDQIPASTLSAVFGGTSTWFLFRLSPKDIPLFPKNLPSIQFTGVYEKQVVQTTAGEDLRDSFAPDWLKDPNYEKPRDVLVDLKPLPFDPKILASLQVGECIHRKADATAEKITTYSMENKPPGSLATTITTRTMAQYGPEPRQEPPTDLESKRDDPDPTNNPKPANKAFPRADAHKA